MKNGRWPSRVKVGAMTSQFARCTPMTSTGRPAAPALGLRRGDVAGGWATPAVEAPRAGQKAEPAAARRARADRAEAQAVMERVIDRAEERIAEPVAAPGETLGGVAEPKSHHESDLLCVPTLVGGDAERLAGVNDHRQGLARPQGPPPNPPHPPAPPPPPPQ